MIDWFLSNKKNSKINGFTNHLWNGVTTNIFAKVVHILVRFNLKIPNLIHIVPNNKITKIPITKVTEQKIQKKRFNYIKVRTKIKVDRSLSSIIKIYN